MFDEHQKPTSKKQKEIYIATPDVCIQMNSLNKTLAKFKSLNVVVLKTSKTFYLLEVCHAQKTNIFLQNEAIQVFIKITREKQVEAVSMDVFCLVF